MRARRGFGFDDPNLRGHFSTVGWYHHTQLPELTKVDRTNLKLIDSVLKTIHQPEPSDLLNDPLIQALSPGPRRFYGWG